MPITPLSTPLKTEYKPLGLEAFAQPLSQMQAKFDVAKSQIEDADYKIDALSWASGDQEATKALANSYNQKASDLAGKLIRSGNYREASSALKKINKDYNNDPGIQAYQSNAAAYKAIVEEMDKAVTAGTMTPEYRDTKLRKIKSEFSGTNFDPKTNAYNKINASSAMNNIKIEDKILAKAEKLASASAEQQDFMLGQEVTSKLRKNGRLAFEDIVAHLRQSSEFKEYSKEKAELDFFAENEKALQSENPFALADDLIGSKLAQIDQALEFYSQDPEKFKNEILEAQAYKEELLALAENKTQDPDPYFGTAENIYIANHDYLRGVGGTAADIYDYQKIDIEKSGSGKTAKKIEEINNSGPLSTEVIGVTDKKALKIDSGSSGITQEEILVKAGVDPEIADLGTYMTTLDNDVAKKAAVDAGKMVYTGTDFNVDAKKVTALKESQDILQKQIESNSNLIQQKKLELQKPNLSANKEAMLQDEIKALERENLKYYEAKNDQTSIFSNLITLEGANKKPAEKQKLSATKKADGSFEVGGFNLTLARMTSPEYTNKMIGQMAANNTYGKPFTMPNSQMIESDDAKVQKKLFDLSKQYGNDVVGFLEALGVEAQKYAASPEVQKTVEKNKLTSSNRQYEIAYMTAYVNASYDENGVRITNQDKLDEIKAFNTKSNSSLEWRDWKHYAQYLRGEHLEDGAKEEKEFYVRHSEKGHLPNTPKGNIKTPSKYDEIMDGYNKVQTALDKYEKNYNYIEKLKAQNTDNPYAKTLNNVLEAYEEATTLKNARVQTVNAVVIDENFAKKVPSAQQFMTNAASNLKEYVVDYDPNTGTTGSTPAASNIVPTLYDTKTLRGIAVVENPDGTTSNIYAVNRKSTVQNDLLSAAFQGKDKKVGEIAEEESLINQNSAQIKAINDSNPDVLYITDRGTNFDLINQAKLAEVNSLEILQGAPDYEKQTSAYTQAKNTALNDLVNVALLDTDVRMTYVSQADNLRENLIEGKVFEFPSVAPSVIKTVDQETKYVQAGDEENAVIAKPGDKVYNTIEYATTENRQLAYRVTRNIIVGYNQDNTPIIKKQIVEAGPMSAKGIPQQMMKHSIMFGVGNPNTVVLDGNGNPFNTDRGF
tara:strand:- start:20177 stop:23521 length:3345 start_codon:yes stop_codon:yes gene_type:complete